MAAFSGPLSVLSGHFGGTLTVTLILSESEDWSGLSPKGEAHLDDLKDPGETKGSAWFAQVRAVSG